MSELPEIICKVGVTPRADGSALMQIGETTVMASVFGPHEVAKNKPIMNIQFHEASFCSNDKRKMRTQEINNMLRDIFTNVVLIDSLPNSQVDITINVLQIDDTKNSTISACVNAATLALIHAGIPVKDFAISCSSSLLNVSEVEEPDITITILPKTKKILSLESQGRVPIDKVEYLIDMATRGCDDIHKILKETILNYVASSI